MRQSDWSEIVRIWEHTLQELTGGKQPMGERDGDMPPQPFVHASIVPITHNPRFATAFIQGSGSLPNQALVELKNGQWEYVASYVDDTIHLDPSVRGKGLAEELLL